MSILPNWQSIINDDLPEDAVKVKFDHVLPTGVKDRLRISVLRVDDVADQFLSKSTFPEGRDGKRGDDRAIRDDSLLDGETVDRLAIENDDRVFSNLRQSAKLHKRVSLLRR